MTSKLSLLAITVTYPAVHPTLADDGCNSLCTTQNFRYIAANVGYFSQFATVTCSELHASISFVFSTYKQMQIP